MRIRNLLATTACAGVACAFGIGAGTAAAAPSSNADCVAQFIATGGAPGAAPGQAGPAGGDVVSSVAQLAHSQCVGVHAN